MPISWHSGTIYLHNYLNFSWWKIAFFNLLYMFEEWWLGCKHKIRYRWEKFLLWNFCNLFCAVWRGWFYCIVVGTYTYIPVIRVCSYSFILYSFIYRYTCWNLLCFLYDCMYIMRILRVVWETQAIGLKKI